KHSATDYLRRSPFSRAGDRATALAEIEQSGRGAAPIGGNLSQASSNSCGSRQPTGGAAALALGSLAAQPPGSYGAVPAGSAGTIQPRAPAARGATQQNLQELLQYAVETGRPGS